MEADYLSILDGIGFMIAEIVKNKKGKIKALSRDFTAEIKIAEQKAVGIGDVRKSDVKQNIFACPDCDGGLWEIKKKSSKDIVPYRTCLHKKDPVSKQAEAACLISWVASRMMEEHKHL